MLNIEKYKEAILFCIDSSGNTPALKNGKLVPCNYDCSGCEFSVNHTTEDSCVANFICWLAEERN